jgi:hypothetical protein
MRLQGIVLAGFISLAWATAAHAQEGARPQILDEVYACRSIADGDERLACFDRAVGSLQTAEESGQLVAVDTVRARGLEREAFGFNLPSLSRLLPDLIGGAGEPEERLDNVEMTIAQVRQRGYNRYVFEMENGQVWASVEVLAATATRHFRRGTTVTIRSAAMGSFLMNGRSGPAHRVQRER